MAELYISMPFDLDIEVEALALEDHEIDGLRADTLYVDYMHSKISL